jgi:hypothetical protein
MWTLVIIIVALNSDKTSAPAITPIPGFTSEESCEGARENTSYGNLDVTKLFGFHTARHGVVAFDCIKVDWQKLTL